MGKAPPAWKARLPELQGLPLIPCGAGAKFKAPIDPATGHLAQKWETWAKTPEQINAMNGVVLCVGTRCGPDAGNMLILDIDGQSAIDVCTKHGAMREMAGWVIARDTAADRLKVAFLIEPELLHFFTEADGRPMGKRVMQTKPPVFKKNEAGETVYINGRPQKEEDQEQLEVFWNSGQCIVLGEHRESGGNYVWQGSPKELAPITPEWWSVVTEVLNKSEAPGTRKQPKGSGETVQSGPQSPCPICGRDTSGACTVYLPEKKGDPHRVNCFVGQTFNPPLDLEENATIEIDGTHWAYKGAGVNRAVGEFRKFLEVEAPQKAQKVDLENISEDVEALEDAINTLAELCVAPGDHWNEISLTQSQIMGVTRLKPTDIQGRLFEKLGAEKWGLVNAITEPDNSSLDAGCFFGVDEDFEEVLREPILEGLLYNDAVHLIWGEPGTGKTQHAMQMIHAWITGQPYLDAPAGMPFPKGKKVLFLFTDAGPEQASGDWKSYVASMGLKDDPLWNSTVECRRADAKRKVAGWVLSPKDLDWLHRKLEIGQYAGVFIDSLAAVVDEVPGDGLSIYDPSFAKVYKTVNQLVVKHCPLVWIHHSKKDGKGSAGFSGVPVINRHPGVVHRLTKYEEQNRSTGEVLARRYFWHADKTRAGLERQFEVLKDPSNRFFVKHSDLQLDFSNALLLLLPPSSDQEGKTPIEIQASLEIRSWELVGDRRHDADRKDVVEDHVRNLEQAKESREKQQRSKPDMSNGGQGKAEPIQRVIDVPKVKRSQFMQKIRAHVDRGFIEAIPGVERKQQGPGRRSKAYRLTLAGENQRRILIQDHGLTGWA